MEIGLVHNMPFMKSANSWCYILCWKAWISYAKH